MRRALNDSIGNRRGFRSYRHGIHEGGARNPGSGALSSYEGGHASPEQTRRWRSIAQDSESSGSERNWDEVFVGYHSAADWPSAYFWRELSAYYPDAKILLTVRSPESWHASMEKTIFKSLGENADLDSVGVKLIAERVFGGRLDDRDHAISIYQKNIEEAQAAFDQDRLLTYSTGDGWEPLCRFLGKPVPDVSYPRTNAMEDFDAMIAKLREQGRC